LNPTSGFASSTGPVLETISASCGASLRICCSINRPAANSAAAQHLLLRTDFAGRLLTNITSSRSVHLLMAGRDLPVESNDVMHLLSNHDAFVNECGFAAGRIWQG
jgi:hypothetical protein